MQPYRKKAATRLKATRRAGTWRFDQLSRQPIVQAVDDYRARSRSYAELPKTLMRSSKLRNFLREAADMVDVAHGGARSLEIVVWLVSVTATANQSGLASPEGIHQDGADYIVPALIVDRDNIVGGESVIRRGRGGPVIFRDELQVGEGLLHSDRGSDLWHFVTPFGLQDKLRRTGHRNTIGLDFFIND